MLIKILLVILAVMIVGSIMLQQGKGSDLGSAFGGGSSDSLFGPLGPSNFFSKLTWGLITVFYSLFIACIYIKTRLTLNVSEDLIEEVFDEPPVE